MEETIDYAEEYLQLKNKEMWHKAENYVQLEENSLKEKAQFNDFVNFKVKQGRKQLAEEIINQFDEHFKEWEDLNYTIYEEFKEKLQKEIKVED